LRCCFILRRNSVNLDSLFEISFFFKGDEDVSKNLIGTQTVEGKKNAQIVQSGFIRE